jgi:DNA mismatch endonuclease, patch repair protein
MDTLTPAERSTRMALIRSKNTKPELEVRKLTHALGYRYSLHKRGLPGKPDLAFPCQKKVIFVHGCFWHSHEGCRVANQPKSRSDFWENKFKRNKARDASNQLSLMKGGWDVCVIWECETKNISDIKDRLRHFLGPTARERANGGPRVDAPPSANRRRSGLRLVSGGQ